MIKFAVIVLSAITLSLYFIYFSVGRSEIYEERLFAANGPYFYGDSSRLIKTVHLTALYFVPKNKEPAEESEWKEQLEAKVAELSKFHALVTGRSSLLVSTVYPVPIRGLSDNIVYDTDDTNFGNPNALLNIREELRERLLDPRGDLYDADIANINADLHALYILYEGVGAAGMDSAALLSRTYLSRDEYKSTSGSLFAHEFYHTLGVPDGYGETGTSTTGDLMGYSRTIPLEQAYLATSTLNKLGL